MIEDAKVSSSSSVNVSVASNSNDEFPVAALHTEDDYYRALAKIKQLEETLEAEKEDLKAKAAFYDLFESSKMIMPIEEFVGMLESAGVHTGRNKILETLRNEGYLEHDKYGKNQSTSKNADEGLVELKKNAKKSMVPMLTAKGVIHFTDYFTKKK